VFKFNKVCKPKHSVCTSLKFFWLFQVYLKGQIVLKFIYFNINQGWEGEKIGIFSGVFNTDNDSRHFERHFVVTKLKAIHFCTQSTEKHHKEKNILNIHQVRLLAQYSYASIANNGKAMVFRQNYFACQCRLL
jgi:hypothetical protein